MDHDTQRKTEQSRLCVSRECEVTCNKFTTVLNVKTTADNDNKNYIEKTFEQLTTKVETLADVMTKKLILS